MEKIKKSLTRNRRLNRDLDIYLSRALLFLGAVIYYLTKNYIENGLMIYLSVVFLIYTSVYFMDNLYSHNRFIKTKVLGNVGRFYMKDILLFITGILSVFLLLLSPLLTVKPITLTELVYLIVVMSLSSLVIVIPLHYRLEYLNNKSYEEVLTKLNKIK